MWISLPLYLGLLIWSIVLAKHTASSVDFFSYTPAVIPHCGGLALLQLLATTMSMVPNGLVAADIGRFIPKRQQLISAFTMTYVNIALCFIGATLLGAWLGLKFKESNPGVYFPALLGVWGVIFVVITQVRINLINAYSGSLALTTFFSRIFDFSPGRYWWLVLISVLSILLMFGNILSHLVQVLSFQGMFIIAWAMSVVSYILFNKNIRKISSDSFAFQKGSIPNYHPIGLGALFIALLVAVPMALGLIGPTAKSLAPLFAAAIAFCAVPVLTVILKLSRRQN
jgi:purine-cytosine permease-like protein